MKPWETWGAPGSDGLAWFQAVATDLLRRCALEVGGRRVRLLEVEGYVKNAHFKDPFCHGNEVQKRWGRWYLHRHGDVIRTASYKGLDLALGDGSGTVGILIRTYESDAGVVCGPSLCVDQLIAWTASGDVTTLDAAIGGALVWSDDNPVRLVEAEQPETPILWTPRVGLTLKYDKPDRRKLLLAPFRAVVEPTKVKKGRPHMVCALLADGKTVAEISALLGSPKGSVQRYADAYAKALAEGDLGDYVGKTLDGEELCAAAGAWRKTFGG
jgi:hypothetical protein